MSDILCITNRALCEEDFLERIEKIAKCHPAGIVLREKDLLKTEYSKLAEQVMDICKKQNVQCILHNFTEVAEAMHAEALHLPLYKLRELPVEKRAGYKSLGASCHSVEEAKEAEQLGCTYIFAGHIFATDCKKGVPPRGISFLQEMCDAVMIPVYAIGGISERNIAEVRKAGAAGACVMSGIMHCQDPESYLKSF